MNRANPIHISLSLLAALILLGISLLYLAPAQAQTKEHHAGVVIQFIDGSVRTYCVSFNQETISGLDALVRTGLEIGIKGDGSMGAEVCKIGADGCNYPEQPCACESYRPNGVYWSYHHFKEGKWRASTTGASSYKVRDGDIEGWAWTAGKPPSSVPTLDRLCNVSQAQATSTSMPLTATPTPPRPTSTRVPPSPTRVVAAIPTAVRRSDSPTPTKASASDSKQPVDLSTLPQPVDTVPPSFTPGPPGPSDQPISPPPPRPTEDQPSPTRPQPAQLTRTPVLNVGTPTIAARSTSPVSVPPAILTDEPVATVQATVIITPSAPRSEVTPIDTVIASQTPTVQPKPSNTLSPILTSASQTASPADTALVAATPTPAQRLTTSDSENLARNIALATVAAVSVGLGVLTLIRRRRTTINKGPADGD